MWCDKLNFMSKTVPRLYIYIQMVTMRFMEYSGIACFEKNWATEKLTLC